MARAKKWLPRQQQQRVKTFQTVAEIILGMEPDTECARQRDRERVTEC